LARRIVVLQEIRMAGIVEAVGRHKSDALTCVEAASLLGMNEQQFRRFRDACAD
jgi:hypothetical protein